MTGRRRRLAVAWLVSGVGVGVLVPAGASAASVAMCVPTAAGQAVTSAGTGSCATGTTKVAMPASAADQQTLISILPHIKYVAGGVGGKPTVRFSGVNVQVVSGSGSTGGTPNGEGNLVVGYAENPSNRARTGSHDLIVGTDNGWTSFGQLVAGSSNTASGDYATAFGLSNTASGVGSLVAGDQNTASGAQASATGGQGNQAVGAQSSVTGGTFNLTRDTASTIAGGCENLAGAGPFASGGCPFGDEAILGGASNTATGDMATVSGGVANEASGLQAAVAAGWENVASGTRAQVAGGWGNLATGDFDAILGGCGNATGPGPYGSRLACDGTVSEASTIGGGMSNTANGPMASVSGGNSNTATGTFGAWTGGGWNNTNTGSSTSIAGGAGETLSGPSNESRVGNTLFSP